ncbi:MAG: arginine--tRNA ligase [Mycobacteriales bacterium]|nr:MAG: arginine--tRNA ligase [Pseudonocardiales bacterium]
MTPDDLAETVRAAVAAAIDAGDFAAPVPDDVVVEHPKNREHGDYATNVALRLAEPAGKPPREVAAAIKSRLEAAAGIAAVDIAGPGFLNVTLAKDAFGELARTVVTAGTAYGSNTALAGQRINLEFISANPTGPLHIAHVRWAAVGDAMARLMQASGAYVEREYYFNDAGAQIERFAASLYAVATGAPVPENGYQGHYIEDIARRVIDANPGLTGEVEEKAVEVFRREGIELMFADIRASLERLGVHFDVYFNERDLHASGAIEDTVRRLRAAGHVFDADGAIWLRTTDFGDDKDRVIVRSDGRPTYFCADLAYYVDKRERGFDKVVIILGADHHGYLGRMRAMVAGLGEDPDEHFEIPLGQLVTVHGSRLSKRAGNVVTLDELVDAISVDAARYALVRSSMDSAIDIDADLWVRHTNENPVFYVQYAHARLASLQRNAAELGIDRGDDFDPGLLSDERETDLLSAVGEYPRSVASAAELREPHRVARYLESLAGTYHRFYDACRVLPQGDEEATPLTAARLWLCEATRVVLANGLGVLGVSAPDRM